MAQGNISILDLPPEKRAKRLAALGMTEEEYRAYMAEFEEATAGSEGAGFGEGAAESKGIAPKEDSGPIGGIVAGTATD